MWDVSLDESGGTIFGLEASSLTSVPRSGVAVAWERHPAAESGLGIRSSTGAWVATAMDPLINNNGRIVS